MQERRECADCWRKRFREETKRRLENLTYARKLEALNFEVDRREEETQKIVEDSERLRMEIMELRGIAGDVALARYPQHSPT